MPSKTSDHTQLYHLTFLWAATVSELSCFLITCTVLQSIGQLVCRIFQLRFDLNLSHDCTGVIMCLEAEHRGQSHQGLMLSIW